MSRRAFILLAATLALGPATSRAGALEAGGIVYRLGGDDKASALRAVVENLRLPDEVDRAFLFRVLLAREALGAGSKGDFAFHGAVPGRAFLLGMWVHLGADANAAQAGLQVYDAEGECLFALIPADWTNFKSASGASQTPELVGSLDDLLRLSDLVDALLRRATDVSVTSGAAQESHAATVPQLQ